MKVIVAGGRDFKNYLLLKEKLDYYLELIPNPEIVSGKQKTRVFNSITKEWEEYGADYLGEVYAKEKGYIVHGFPANWEKYKKAAGFIRNEEMAKFALKQFLVAFWDGKSPGTKNMIELAKKYEIKTKVVNY